MTDKQKQIITKICGKIGHKELEKRSPCLCREINMFIEKSKEFIILGFLSEKDTLVKCFGEKIIKIGRNIEDVELETIQRFTSWQYHGQQMVGMDVFERLEYFEKEMG